MTFIMLMITVPESGDGTDKVWSDEWITGGAAEVGHQIHAVRSYIMMSLLFSTYVDLQLLLAIHANPEISNC